jgi:nucleotide-binding universal stress UspA family protein
MWRQADVVHPRRKGMFERIVAAIDSDPERSVKVVEAAKELAKACGSTVLVAHIRDVERPAASVTGRAGAIPPSLHLESEEEARGLVDAAVERLRGAGVQAGGQVGPGPGSTARQLLAIADSDSANLIVIGDRGSHVSDVLLGSVAHRVVHLAKVPVLLVR